ncbi:MAG: lipopolysaccharide biosynthesis protein [Verrucomicrobiae bacterium]|nr:lipopolysaccharide biosynthesis protein [Verrucomicrobiae bacterium]NNJ42516.1 lipopolysaccharide biosynthesis protein [Akkermansiaceae bacterium]
MPSVKKSFAWSAVEQFVPKLIQVAVTILLARVLEPTDYGLVGMLAVFIGIAMVLADSGLSASLIQKKEVTQDDETSVFYINIGLGLSLALLLCAISPLVAQFYDQDLLVPLLCLQSLSIVVSSFAIVQRALMTRAMEFHKMALITLAGTTVSGCVAVGMAYAGWGVWSLIGMLLSGNITQVILFWISSSWSPRGNVRIANIRKIWDFSSYLLYCQLIGIVFQNMYSVIIGKFYSPASLGYYDRAQKLHMLPAGTMSGMIGKVAFPLFSQIQDDKELLLCRMRELIRVSLLFSAAGMSLLALIADPLVPLLMTEKWMPSVPLLRILCYSAMICPISSMFLMALQAQGYSKLNFRLESMKMAIGVIVVLSAASFGIEALAWSVVVSRCIAYFINVWYHVKLLGYRWKSQAFDILPTFVLCAVAAFIAWQVTAVDIDNALLHMMMLSSVFVLSLGAGIFCFRSIFFQDLWKHGNQTIGLLRRQLLKSS